MTEMTEMRCAVSGLLLFRPQLRAANTIVVPRYNTSTFGRRAFSVAGPTVWNSLPDKLGDPSQLIDSFRRQLKTFLFAD